uniref:Right parietal ganglion peptide n=1 Tax=Ambigolimax valentianus TaxID=1338344 RepID=A0A140KFM2_9EUPU|nr:right parietal ganglion peptide [Ambigolimax valentianus]
MGQTTQRLLALLAITSLVQPGISRFAALDSALNFDTVIPVSDVFFDQWNKKANRDPSLAFKRLRRQPSDLTSSNEVVNDLASRRWGHRKLQRYPVVDS